MSILESMKNAVEQIARPARMKSPVWRGLESFRSRMMPWCRLSALAARCVARRRAASEAFYPVVVLGPKHQKDRTSQLYMECCGMRCQTCLLR